MSILVTGAGGFIGSHLVRELRARGEYVIGVDLKQPYDGMQHANEFHMLDLREPDSAKWIVSGAKEVYHLAADMGGIGYITKDHARIARNNTLIDMNMLEAAHHWGVDRFLYTSSACAYPAHLQDSLDLMALSEGDAVPADPEPGYGWEKLYAEQLATYYAEDYGMTVRMTRFMNVYGPNATWDGSKEKALLALCRKVIDAEDGGEIEVWGDGRQVRDFVYVSDVVDALIRVMHSGYKTPVNVGTGLGININRLAQMIIGVSGKKLSIRNDVTKPQGVRHRVGDITLLHELGWTPKVSLEDGVKRTYEWVKHVSQVEAFA